MMAEKRKERTGANPAAPFSTSASEDASSLGAVYRGGGGGEEGGEQKRSKTSCPLLHEFKSKFIQENFGFFFFWLPNQNR